MSIYKRGRIYYYHFVFNGQHIQESTKQGNPRVARQMEAARRTSLAKGEVGIREKKQLRTICGYEALAKLRRDAITSEHAADFARHEMTHKHSSHVTRGKAQVRKKSRKTAPTGTLSVSTVNTSLRALRRVLRLANEWGVIPSVPKIRLLSGEQHRDRVITQDEESKYLAMADEPLVSIATVLADTA